MPDPSTQLVWFHSWPSIGRIALCTIIAFGWTLMLIRMFGKRTISKTNPSDFVMTVAVGSTMANFILPGSVPVADGLGALFVLLLLQIGIEWVTTRSERARRPLEGHPTLLLHRGRFLEDVMRRENINHEEIRKAVRTAGIADLEKVYAVILEIDGTFSVIPAAGSVGSALTQVEGIPAGEKSGERAS